MPAHSSKLRYTFTPAGLAPIVLVDFGDLLLDHPDISAEQTSANFASIGFDWASPMALGGATRSIAFGVRKQHTDLVKALTFCRTLGLLHSGLNVTGVLTEEIEDGPTFEHNDAVILAAPTKPYENDASQTVTMFRLVAGDMAPVAGLPYEPGLPINWLFDAIDSYAVAIDQM